MNCHTLDSQVTAYLDGELVAEARLQIERHLAGCAPCARRVEVERHNHSLVRALVREASPAAPQRLRASVFAAVRLDDARAGRHRLARLTAAAAGVALAIAVGNHQYRTHQLRLYEQDAARRHARQFPMEIEQPREAIEAWFGGKLDHRVHVPRFPNARATGGTLTSSARQAGGLHSLRCAPPHGLVRIRRRSRRARRGARPRGRHEPGVQRGQLAEGDVVYQLVTDLEEHDVRQLLPRGLATTPAVEVRPAGLQR
jgi:mycothiol system anti-sigma-R factor